MESKIKAIIQEEDIDGYNHLNNARYGLYFEQGRDDLTRELGLDALSLRKRGIGFQVKRASYEYLTPVEADQQIEISSKLHRSSKAKITIAQTMFLKGEPVSHARAEYFFINLNTKKPIKPPEDICERLTNGNTKS